MVLMFGSVVLADDGLYSENFCANTKNTKNFELWIELKNRNKESANSFYQDIK